MPGKQACPGLHVCLPACLPGIPGLSAWLPGMPDLVFLALLPGLPGTWDLADV